MCPAALLLMLAVGIYADSMEGPTAGCTFDEDSDPGLCEYRQGQDDDFDWQLIRTYNWPHTTPDLLRGKPMRPDVDCFNNLREQSSLVSLSHGPVSLSHDVHYPGNSRVVKALRHLGIAVQTHVREGYMLLHRVNRCDPRS
ncbi:unnamed protein product [Pleuronectes platessa]|uniref:MAM domain-containing protein n=1 Tax=Pleuronectes platessa TaxID=8262 RepID=A0A9N7UCV1_PLEPL|nr:unnamed protein product [Pleuronectes platessa]